MDPLIKDGLVNPFDELSITVNEFIRKTLTIVENQKNKTSVIETIPFLDLSKKQKMTKAEQNMKISQSDELFRILTKNNGRIFSFVKDKEKLKKENVAKYFGDIEKKSKRYFGIFYYHKKELKERDDDDEEEEKEEVCKKSLDFILKCCPFLVEYEKRITQLRDSQYDDEEKKLIREGKLPRPKHYSKSEEALSTVGQYLRFIVEHFEISFKIEYLFCTEMVRLFIFGMECLNQSAYTKRNKAWRLCGILNFLRQLIRDQPSYMRSLDDCKDWLHQYAATEKYRIDSGGVYKKNIVERIEEGAEMTIEEHRIFVIKLLEKIEYYYKEFKSYEGRNSKMITSVNSFQRYFYCLSYVMLNGQRPQVSDLYVSQIKTMNGNLVIKTRKEKANRGAKIIPIGNWLEGLYLCWIDKMRDHLLKKDFKGDKITCESLWVDYKTGIGMNHTKLYQMWKVVIHEFNPSLRITRKDIRKFCITKALNGFLNMKDDILSGNFRFYYNVDLSTALKHYDHGSHFEEIDNIYKKMVNQIHGEQVLDKMKSLSDHVSNGIEKTFPDVYLIDPRNSKRLFRLFVDDDSWLLQLANTKDYDSKFKVLKYKSKFTQFGKKLKKLVEKRRKSVSFKSDSVSILQKMEEFYKIYESKMSERKLLAEKKTDVTIVEELIAVEIEESNSSQQRDNDVIVVEDELKTIKIYESEVIQVQDEEKKDEIIHVNDVVQIFDEELLVQHKVEKRERNTNTYCEIKRKKKEMKTGMKEEKKIENIIYNTPYRNGSGFHDFISNMYTDTKNYSIFNLKDLIDSHLKEQVNHFIIDLLLKGAK
jgi:hypothetical protein